MNETECLHRFNQKNPAKVGLGILEGLFVQISQKGTSFESLGFLLTQHSTTPQRMLEAMNLVLFEDALMHLPGDPKSFLFCRVGGRTRIMDLLGSFVRLKCGIRDHKGMRSQILIQDAHQPHHPAEAWQRRVPQKGPPWLHSDSRCWLLCLQIEIS